ncbi:hypothetical protein G7Z17_g8233 [Cylindrodendrum hubeiense]|uniref:F-box domain-containing protein n=1 Tax=Cylindrodendrum hubeiense TaxID=595255 RepID=A0A9P5H2C8_9HYPO|nr:hypothetical protein G7Z17_g8233 [Cylindrodendrum hubeiense]
MDDNESDYAKFKAHNLRGFPAKMHSLSEAGHPPRGVEIVPVVSAEGSAISTPEQLQGLLCLEEPPECVQTTTASESEVECEAQVIRVFPLLYRDFLILEERATVEDGPVVVFGENKQMVSKIVQTLIPSAYPPRSLNHAQTCDALKCHLSSKESSEHRDLIPSADQTPPTPVVCSPELLEIVLFHLDIKTRLVSASRVCKFWLETINRSPLLQKASFFQPEQPFSSDQDRQMNPLLIEAFGDTFFGSSPPARRAESFWKLPWSPQALVRMKAPTGSVLGVEPTCRQKSFTRAGASWRRMLVSQPPPPFIGLSWVDDHPQQPRQRHRIDSLRLEENSSSPPGVTMGQLYDTVQFLTMQQLYSGLFFKVQWDRVCDRKRRGNSNSKNHDSTLERTNLMVDFWDEDYYLSAHYGPFNMKATRTVFKCEEFVRLCFGGKATIEGPDTEAAALARLDDIELWEPLVWEE